MNTTICSDCGDELEIGDYPFCPHGSIYGNNAARFDPILVYEMPDGQHFFPGSNKDKPPVEGAKPIVLDTLRKADRFVRETNQRLQMEMDVQSAVYRDHSDRRRKENREQLQSELVKRGLRRENIDAILADRDGAGASRQEIIRQFEAIAKASGQPLDPRRAEQIYERTQVSRRDPNYRPRASANFQIEVFSQDSSNRSGRRDASTGWKEKRS